MLEPFVPAVTSCSPFFGSSSELPTLFTHSTFFVPILFPYSNDALYCFGNVAMKSNHVLSRSLHVLLSATLLVAISSCSGNKRVYPVSGKVLFEGKPAARAIVKFYAVDPAGKKDSQAVVPQAVVDDDGSFRLTTYSSEDGAPAGKYNVSVFWAKPSKGGDDYDKPLIPARYLNAETSGLTAVVEERATELPPFQLRKN
jgi:hypothetical protein